MRPLTRFEAQYDRDDQTPEIVLLRAGKFELDFEGRTCEPELDPLYLCCDSRRESTTLN